MGFLRRWGIKIVETISTTTIGHGILLWLATRNVHPDKWGASMIQEAASAQVTNAAWWVIAGSFGITCTVLIEYGKILWGRRNRSAAAVVSPLRLSPPPPPIRTGIIAPGSNLKGNLVVGFDVGINAPGATIFDNEVRETSGGNFTTDGRFSSLSNEQLNTQARIMISKLRVLRQQYRDMEPQPGSPDYGPRSLANTINLCNVFSFKYVDDAHNLCAEIIGRIGTPININIDHVRWGMEILLSRRAVGHDPINLSAGAIEYLAERLPK